MAFKWVNNDSGAPETRLSSIYATDSEAFTEGEAVILSSGKWTKATNGVAVAGFARQTLAAGTSQLLEVTLAKPDDNFEAPYTGTPDAAFVVGVGTADVSSDGLSVLSSDVTSGAFAILGINTTKVTCRLKVKNRQLS